jgi:hypothetical protein
MSKGIVVWTHKDTGKKYTTNTPNVENTARAHASRGHTIVSKSTTPTTSSNKATTAMGTTSSSSTGFMSMPKRQTPATRCKYCDSIKLHLLNSWEVI